MSKKITMMCVQPCTLYYAWQVEVMLTNFTSLSLHENFNIVCLFAYNKKEPDWEQKVATIKKVENKFRNEALFHYYEDTRVYPISYISSIRPNILKQHFFKFPHLSNVPVFYHDCDVVFTKYPDFLSNLTEDDMTWYVSDTISYIGHHYILSKGQDIMDRMTEIVGINETLVKNKLTESGGAQYLIKGADWRMFEKVEKDCERLFKEITAMNNEKKRQDPSHHELQIWCADMWALLWAAWMRGFTTKVIPEMQFCWATDLALNWDRRYIFHNAGVTGGIADTHFLKSKYITSLPFADEGMTYDKEKASYKYFEIIKSIGKNSCLYE